MAQRSGHDITKPLSTIFNSIDTNNDGFLTLEEITEFFHEVSPSGECSEFFK